MQPCLEVKTCQIKGPNTCTLKGALGEGNSENC